MKMAKKVLIVTSLGALLVLFQNCTASTTGFGTGVNGAVNSMLASKPMPVDVTLNQISYMSCPANVGTATNTGDPLSNPFYRIRFGAYDNSINNGFTSIIGATHVGGIGFSKDAMNYMRSISKSPNSSMLINYLSSSPYTAGTTPVATLIYRSRTASAITPNPMGTPFLTSFNDATFQYSLASQTQLPNDGTQKMGFFSSMDPGIGSLVGSINQAAGTELQLRQSLPSQFLFMGFAPNAATADPAQMTTGLVGPDNNVTKRLFGTGYSLSFGTENYIAQNGISEWSLNPATGFNPVMTPQQGQWDCFPLTVVREIDRKYYTVNTAVAATTEIAGWGWNLFANPVTLPQKSMAGYCPIAPFTVPGGTSVPNGYQAYPYNPTPDANTCLALPNALVPGQNAYLPFGGVIDPRVAGSATGQYALLTPNLPQTGTVGATNGIRMNYFSSKTVVNNQTGLTVNADIDDAVSQLANYYAQSNPSQLLLGGATGGNFYACPPEDPTTMTQAQLERLRIVRRFLLPELWDVNISQACAVPTSTANSTGNCYASGDTNPAKIIQYDGIDGISCGTNAGGQTINECPARVSFCWRYR